MPRPQIHKTSTDRYAAYRERKALDRDQLRRVGLQAQGKPIPAGQAIASVATKWFRIVINVHRHELDMKGELSYIMEEAELLRLQHDLSNFKIGPSLSSTPGPHHGTYAFADSGRTPTHVPGMTTIAFYGLTITSMNLVSDYEPPNTYSVSKGAVDLLMSQGKRPHPLQLSTVEVHHPAAKVGG